MTVDSQSPEAQSQNRLRSARQPSAICSSCFFTVICNLSSVTCFSRQHLVPVSAITVGESIVGGVCSASELITARSTGSETAVLTKLISGKNNRVRDEAEAVRRQASSLVRRLSETTRDIKQFSIKEFADIKGTVEERMKLWAAMSEKVWLNDRLVTLSKRKNALLATIDTYRSSKIQVLDKVYPQTQIEIDDAGLTVKKLTQFVTFSKDYDAGILRIT